MLVLLALLAGPAAALSPAYLEAVRRYHAGDHEVAVALPMERSAAEEVAALERLRAQAACRDCDARARFAAFPFEAAVMLHTDRDVQERESLEEVEEAAPGAAPDLEAARRILELMPDEERRRRLERPWFLAVVLHLYKRGQWPLAHRYLSAALRRYPEDAQLQLARGSLIEAEITLDVREVAARDVLEAAARRRGARPPALDEVSGGLREAEACYRRALRADPDLFEARVRIGRVLHLSGSPGRAAAELARVVETPEADARLTYLAWLFLGAAHEAERHLAEALRAYQAAAAAIPEGQAAHIALSHVHHQLGDRAASAEMLDAAVAPAGRRRTRDPWWDYRWGQVGQLDAWLRALRQQATR